MEKPLRKTYKILNDSGQSQLVAAVVLTTVMLTLGLFTLEYAQLTSGKEVLNAKRSEMRAALDLGVKFAAQLFHGDAGCDPVILDQKIDRLQSNSTIGSLGTAPGARQINIDVTDTSQFVLTFGSIAGGGIRSPPDAIPLTVASLPGNSVDTAVDISTTSNGMRMTQTVVLLNTCNYPCIPDAGEPPGTCNWQPPGTVTQRDAIAFHDISGTQLANFPSCNGNRRIGDITNTFTYSGSPPCTDDPLTPLNECCDDVGNDGIDDRIDLADLMILKNYLQNGTNTGSCPTILEGTGATNSSCADLNRDGVVNDPDLTIMEKLLRGYISCIPTQGNTTICYNVI